MHTDNLRKLALETNDGVLCGPALGAADEIDRLRAEIKRLTKERDREALTREGILQKRINDLLGRAEKAEAERDEARAQVAMAFEMAEKALEARKYGDPDEREEYAFDAALDRGIVAIRAITSADAKAALEAYGRERVLAKVGEAETTAGPWALDTSTGSEILVKGGCSVIEGEDARYLLRLIAADTSTPAPDAAQFLSTEDGEFNGNVTDEPAAQVTATDLERIAADFEKDSNLDRYICCNGRDCGCQGATAGAYAAYKIRALAGDGK